MINTRDSADRRTYPELCTEPVVQDTTPGIRLKGQKERQLLMYRCKVSSMRIKLLVSILIVVFHAIGHAQGSMHNKVVLISLDGLGADSLRDPDLPAPTIKELMKQGTYAEAMQPINPTITWPNHTAMLTGFNAGQLHLVVNGLVTGQREQRIIKVDTKQPRSRMFSALTLYDVAHAHGLSTAEVDWVAIKDAEHIDWSFPEHPSPGGTMELELMRNGILTHEELERFAHPSQAWRDRIYTRAAVAILRNHHPDLMLIHLLALDTVEHQTGVNNDAMRNTIAFLDDRVKEIVEAVHDDGDLERTTFVLVSDHGQQNAHYQLHADVLLHDMPKYGEDMEQEARCLADGGFAMIYQKNATQFSLKDLQTFWQHQKGIRAALTPEEARVDGWPVPEDTMQAPDLLLYALDDYDFSGATGQEYITTSGQHGAHGYPNTNPGMQAVFIASGRGIRAHGKVPAFSNLQIASTIAEILGIPEKAFPGDPIKAILQ